MRASHIPLPHVPNASGLTGPVIGSHLLILKISA
tara:strand:+ start:2697 stop:2798 length:102 start_codon:yes stop_codon:yes gene_type:complete